jgi:hypothetical protein
MKVYIDKYPPYYSVYDLARPLKWIGVSEDFIGKIEVEFIEKYLVDTWLDKLFMWVNEKNQQKIKVRIDPWDTWSMDSTLPLIIVPMLKQLKETKQGAPIVDDDDVPEELKSTSAPPKEHEYDTDDNWFKRWDYVIDEMIWTFEQKLADDWTEQYYDHSEVDESADISTQLNQIKVNKEGLKKYQERMRNGFRLFGKYYESLWD